MFRDTKNWMVAFSMLALCLASTVEAQSVGQSLDVPMTRLRPIGASSAVDQYRTDTARSASGLRETSYTVSARRTGDSGNAFDNQYRQPVRQTVMLQQYNGPVTAPPLPGGTTTLPQGGYNVPPGGFTAPPRPSLPSGPSVLSQNPQPQLPSNLTPVPVTTSTGIQSDLAPLPQPQLGGGFATMDNCNCISAPTSYVAAIPTDCGGCGVPTNCVVPQSYQAPAQFAPAQFAQVAPTGATLAAPTAGSIAGSAPLPSLLTFGQQYNPVEVGQGILGQPVAYVPGQTFRNWLRYIFP